ncbi:hypothetical protein [Acinetobacter sp. YH12041]|uniref:hypothetical protein n=1 Tax=Acinetobacter sp. YH12041 TaxID=2601049 RepID=UPI0015D414CA|nr:hypothetical protein [Acinetobacter sp. YH12041]
MVNLSDIANKGLIEKRLVKHLNKDSIVFKINAKELITPNRFDICFKLSYLDMKERNLEFAKEIYSSHIEAFGLGEYSEPEKPNKKDLDTFLNEFELIYTKMKDYGFDDTDSVIPIAKDGSILNGSHRVACAIKLGIDVVCVKLDVIPSNYDFNFFKKRLVSWGLMLSSVEALQRYKSNIHTAIIWPVAKNKALEVFKNNISKIYLHESYDLNVKEGAGLIRQVYQGEKWLGSAYNNYEGAANKASFCWGEKSNQLDMIIFEIQDNIIEMKEKIREQIGIGKHCIHISDYENDSAMIWRSLLNKNFHTFLKNEIFLKSINKDNKLKILQQELKEMKILPESFCIVGSMTLELFGLRESRDIDLLIDSNCTCNIGENKIFDVDNFKFDLIGLSNMLIIYNPIYHFWYNDVKFLSIDVLYSYKAERYSLTQDFKDKADIEMIEHALDDSSSIDINFIYGKLFIAKEKYKRKFKKNLKIFLSKIGLLELVKRILR